MIWVKSLWMSDFNLKDCFLFTFSGCRFVVVVAVLVVFPAILYIFSTPYKKRRDEFYFFVLQKSK